MENRIGDEYWGEPPSSEYLRRKARNNREKTPEERYAEEKITEQHLCDILNSETENRHERYVVLNANNKETAQLIFYDGLDYACPDVKVFESCWHDEIIMRVEIKRKESNDEWSLRYNYFYVEKKHFHDYYKIHIKEEIPVRIAFVVGEPNDFTEMYWQNIDKLNETKILKKKYFDRNPNDFYVWDVSFLKELNPNTFYNDLYE